jgi:hypothetical protein
MLEASSSAYPSGRLSLGKSHSQKSRRPQGASTPRRPPFDCGLDLHARSLSVCIMTHDGDILLPRPRQAAPAPCLTASAPSRDGLGGGSQAASPGLGAPPSGPQPALPLASGLPLQCRRCLVGRPPRPRGIPPQWPCCGAAGCARRPLALRPPCGPPVPAGDAASTGGANAPHAWLLATLPPVQPPCLRAARRSPLTPSVPGGPRVGPRLPAPRGWQGRWRCVLRLTACGPPWHALSSRAPRPTTPPPARACALGQAGGRGGPACCPRTAPLAPACPGGTMASRLAVPGATAAASQRSGRAGPQRGNASRPWALAAAAALGLRHPPPAQPSWATRAPPQGTGTACTLGAPPRARAVDARRQRTTGFARARGLPRERAERARLPPHWPGRGAACLARAVRHRCRRLGTRQYASAWQPRARRVAWTPALAPAQAAIVAPRCGGLPRPRACPALASRTGCASPVQRTGGGDSRRARPQRSPARGLCQRRPGGDRASSRVWCRPTGGGPCTRQ